MRMASFVNKWALSTFNHSTIIKTGRIYFLLLLQETWAFPNDIWSICQVDQGLNFMYSQVLFVVNENFEKIEENDDFLVKNQI